MFLVVALGGNAILQPGQMGTAEEQMANVDLTCSRLAQMVAAGHELVVTHGNGPQVGNILIQNEEASHIVPPMPLDVCGAESQGLLGYMIQRSLSNHLRRLGINTPVCTVITQTVVDPSDPAFSNPTKPIGPFYTRERAERLSQTRGFVVKEDANRGWRRVVPSPDPRYIWEKDAIKALVDAGAIVLCAGGGGIPVQIGANGFLSGVEAVIDKDLCAERLATDLGADVLMILTDVDKVAINYGEANQRCLDQITVEEARAYQKEGHFKPGSMGPKVEAAARFVENGGDRAIICSLDGALEALEGRAGTVVSRGKDPFTARVVIGIQEKEWSDGFGH